MTPVKRAHEPKLFTKTGQKLPVNCSQKLAMNPPVTDIVTNHMSAFTKAGHETSSDKHVDLVFHKKIKIKSSHKQSEAELTVSNLYKKRFFFKYTKR